MTKKINLDRATRQERHFQQESRLPAVYHNHSSLEERGRQRNRRGRPHPGGGVSFVARARGLQCVGRDKTTPDTSGDSQRKTFGWTPQAPGVPQRLVNHCSFIYHSTSRLQQQRQQRAGYTARPNRGRRYQTD